MTKEIESASKVIGEPVRKVSTMLVDENGVDIEQMQNIIKKQQDMITQLATIVESRDAEDADITRRLICSKTSKWEVPYTADELTSYTKPELDELHKHVCRVGKKDLSEIDESPTQTIYNAVRKFPKARSNDGAGNYTTHSHTFNLGNK